MSFDDIKRDISSKNHSRIRSKSQNIIGTDKELSTTDHISNDIETTQNDWNQSQKYRKWNSLRWIILGIILFGLNIYKLRRTNNYSQYCCYCFNYAMNHASDTRCALKFDWSMCMNECTCDGCQNNFNITVNVANSTCKSLGITPASQFGQNGCKSHSNLSTKSYFILPKSYKSYGIFILILPVIYCILMIVLSQEKLPCCGKNDDSIIMITIQLFFYNIVLAIFCLYNLFKVFQYYPTEIKDNNNNGICFVDAVPSSVETVLTWFIYTTVGVLILQWILCILQCVCNCKCFQRCYSKCELISIVFVLIQFICFGGALIYANIRIIKVYIDEGWCDRPYFNIANQSKDVILTIYPLTMIILDIFIFISSFDILFFKFCNKYILYCVYQPKIEGLKDTLLLKDFKNNNNINNIKK